jgi:hypothetical protein
MEDGKFILVPVGTGSSSRHTRALAIGSVAVVAEQIFIMYLLKSNKKKVAKLHVFREPKNSHVADVARLPFGQFVHSTSTNVLLSDNHHVHCAREEITAFHYVFIEIEQKESGEVACFLGRPKTAMWPMLRDCRSGNSCIQHVQTCYYLTSIMFIVREKR